MFYRQKTSEGGGNHTLTLLRPRVKICFTQAEMVEVNVIRSIIEIYQVTQVYYSVVVLFCLTMHK